MAHFRPLFSPFSLADVFALQTTAVSDNGRNSGVYLDNPRFSQCDVLFVPGGSVSTAREVKAVNEKQADHWLA